MANVKISALTDGVTAIATDRIPVARSPFAAGDNRYITPGYVSTLFQSTFLRLTGDAFTIVGGKASETTNGTDLTAAYTAAKLTTPHGLALSATNRYTIFLLPGRFTVTTGAFVLDAQFIDIIGLGADPMDVRVESGGKTVSQTANDVLLENFLIHTTLTTPNTLSTGDTAYYPNTGLTLQKCVRMVFTAGVGGNNRGMRLGITYSGTFVDCYCMTDSGFAGNASDSSADAAGAFIRCKANASSFGGGSQPGTNATASGNFYYCESTGGNSFGGSGVVTFGVASGTFIGCRSGFDVNTPYGTLAATTGNHFGVNTASGTFILCESIGAGFCVTGTASGTFLFCRSGNDSFGGAASTVNGVFKFCNAGTGSFGGVGAAVSGTFEYCTASNTSFGSGTASTNTSINTRYCRAGTQSFGGNQGTASGTYVHCDAGGGSFAGGVGAGGTASGIFRHCTAGADSFGGGGSGAGGTASGTFDNCVCSGPGGFGGSDTAAGGVFSGTARGCISGTNSFGSGATTIGTMSGTMERCVSSGRLNATVTGRLDSCRIEAVGVNENAIAIASTPKIYNCTLVATGTGVSINAAAAANAIIAHCRTNKGMHANVTNLVTTPYNVDDTDIA